MSSEEESLRILRELEEGTAWELPREVSTTGGADDSMAGVPTARDFCSDEGGLDGPETPENILSYTGDMVKNGDVKDILVIVNTKDEDQYLFTTLDRNDLIIGMLEVAKMNWFNTQIELSNTEEV